MSGFKKVLNWFVTVESDGSEAPEAAASPDTDKAAAAAVKAAEQGQHARQPADPRRVADIRAPQSGKTLAQELAELDAELAGGRPPSPQPRAEAPRAESYRAESTRATGGHPAYAPSAEPIDLDPDTLANSPLQPLDFDELYANGDLPDPGAGTFTVYKVEDLLASPHLRGLSIEMKRASLLVAMQASGVNVEEVIADAALRDGALDSHDDDLQLELEDLESQTRAENEALEAEAQAALMRLQQQISENTARLEAARNVYAAWKQRKQAEERRLYDAVALFISPDKNPVSL